MRGGHENAQFKVFLTFSDFFLTLLQKRHVTKRNATFPWINHVSLGFNIPLVMETQKRLNSHDVFFFFLRFHSGAEGSVLALVRAPFKAGKAPQQASKITQSISGTRLPSVSDVSARWDERMLKDGSRQRLFTRLAKGANASVLALALAFTSKSWQKLDINDAFAAVSISFGGRFDHDSAENSGLGPAPLVFNSTIGSRTFKICLIFIQMASRRTGNGGQPSLTMKEQTGALEHVLVDLCLLRELSQSLGRRIKFGEKSPLRLLRACSVFCPSFFSEMTALSGPIIFSNLVVCSDFTEDTQRFPSRYQNLLRFLRSCSRNDGENVE